MAKFYPLKLEPQLLEKVWGGNWLVENLGRKGSADTRIGESWEAFSGSIILNGEWQGRTLGQLYQEHKLELAGSVAQKYPNFPLLVKFLDARENLSVQVHPDDALAQELENYAFGKSEMWYVISAEPGAKILYSLNDKATSAEQVASAFNSEQLLEYVNMVPVQAGDVVDLPSRTIHALCEGIVVYELQQESDITYRLYDWGRTGREIHHEKGKQAISLDSRNLAITHPQLQQFEGYSKATLVDGPHFNCQYFQIPRETTYNLGKQSFALLSVIEGNGEIHSPDNSFEAETLNPGDTFFLPANLKYIFKKKTSLPNASQNLTFIIGTAK